MLVIRFIGRLRTYLSKDHLKMTLSAFVTSRLDYCNSLYCGLPKREIDKLQRVQNCAARLVSGVRRSDHITPVMKDLYWVPIGARIDFKILLLKWPSLFISVFQDEWFNRWNFKKMFSFSCRYKNLWDVSVYSKPHFYEKCKYLRNPTTDFSQNSANKPQSSLVLYLQIWRQSILTVELAAQNAGQI